MSIKMHSAHQCWKHCLLALKLDAIEHWMYLDRTQQVPFCCSWVVQCQDSLYLHGLCWVYTKVWSSQNALREYRGYHRVQLQAPWRAMANSASSSQKCGSQNTTLLGWQWREAPTRLEELCRHPSRLIHMVLCSFYDYRFCSAWNQTRQGSSKGVPQHIDDNYFSLRKAHFDVFKADQFIHLLHTKLFMPCQASSDKTHF